jgi:hypothetical protein
MSAERDPRSSDHDDEATVKMPRPATPAEELEDIDPEKTLVREDWESTVIRRVAPRIEQVQSQVAEDPKGEDRFGWEAKGLRRLSQEVLRSGR